MTPPVSPTLAGAQEASRLFAIDQCKRINSQLKDRYNAAFDAWSTEVEAGKRPNTNPPFVPIEWIPQTFSDGFTYEVMGINPVQSPRPVPSDHSESETHTPGEIDAINAPAGDRTLVGAIISGAALEALGADGREIGSPGSRWRKAAKNGPFGTWVWYQRL